MKNKTLMAAAATLVTLVPGLAGAETRLAGLDTLNVPHCIHVNVEELGRKADLRGPSDTRPYCRDETDRIVVQTLRDDVDPAVAATTIAMPLSVFTAPKPVAVTVLPN